MKIVYLYVAFFFSITITAQSIANNEKSIIDVTGTAAMEVSPDEIYIDLCLEERMEDGKKITLENLETDLKNELTKASIPLHNLYISDINAVIAKTGWFTKETLTTGYYSLKIIELPKIKKVFKIFEKLNITSAHITKASHSNIVELRKKNRINAIKAAKHKADYLLNAIGSKTGKPLKVIEQEQEYQNYATVNHLRNSNNYRASSISKIKPHHKGTVQFENIKITSSIHVLFEIQ